MTSDTLYLLSKILLIAAAVTFLLALFLWFKFKIMSVIGDLTGKTAKKAIQRIRTENSAAGGARMQYRSNASKAAAPVAAMNRKTDGINPPPKAASTQETERLSESELMQNDGTTFLMDENDTELLIEKEDTLILNGSTDIPNVENKEIPHVDIKIIDDIVMVHTDEVIT